MLRRPLSCGVILATLLVAASAEAKPDFVVNDSGDAGTGDCNDGNCTLREAFAHLSAGDGTEIGCDAAVFPPGSGTEVNLASPLTATVESGFTLDCTGRSIIVRSEPVTIQSGADHPLAQVTLKSVVFSDDVRICGGDWTARPCDEPVSKVSVSRVSVMEDFQVEGDPINGLTIAGSVFRSDVRVAVDAGGLTGITIVDSHLDDLGLESTGDASRIKIAGNTLRVDLRAEIGDRLKDVVVSDNRLTRGSIELEADDVAKLSITKNRVNTVDDQEEGIKVDALDSMEKVRIDSNVVSGDSTEGDSDNGISLYSASGMKNIKVAKNDVSARFADGISVEAAGAASGVQITDNACAGNKGYGIRLVLDGPKKTKVQGNVTNDNLASGIWVDGSLFDVSKNRARRNGNVGIDGWNADDSSFKKNEGLGNAAQDMSEQGDCATNTWKGNVFQTSNAACIQ